MNPLTTGLGIFSGILAVTVFVLGFLYQGALEDKARITGEYEAFRLETKRIGEAAEERNRKTLSERERIANERIKSLGLRVADATARADRLCKSAGLSAGCRSLPAVPDTSRPVDDTAYNQRLLEVLRHAQTVSDQLIELQAWVSSNVPRQRQSGPDIRPSWKPLENTGILIEAGVPPPSPYSPEEA